MGAVDIDQEVGRRLGRLPGFVSLCRLSPEDAREIFGLESEAEKRAVLGAFPAENRGVREALKREVVYAVAYRPSFFSSFKEQLHGSSVVMMSGGEVVGEEITNRGRLGELKGRRDIILIGSSFILYKDRMRKARGAAKLVLTSRPFPPLDDLARVQDVISGSPSPPVDHYLKVKMNVDTEDPDIGTVIVGFTHTAD